MPRILLIGQQPETVDYTDPGMPPGLDAEKIYAGIRATLADMAGRGWEVDHCLVQPDDTAGATVERQLAAADYDCVVIGGGVRVPHRNLQLFERVLNAVHRAAPRAAIAFNTRPEDSVDAALRQLPKA